MGKGETILVEKPFAFVLKSNLKKERCDYCFTQADLKKCSRCHYVHYCGKGCQRSSWQLHKLECDNLKKILPKTLPDSAHLLIRLILKSQVKLLNFQISDSCKNFDELKVNRTFPDLMSHVPEIRKDKRRMEHLTSLVGVLLTFFGEYDMPDDNVIVETFGKMCINSFNILDDDMNTIGTGVYLEASRLNHSCKPTAVAIFDRTTLYIRAIENLSDFKLDSVRISYIDVLNTPAQRKQELQSMYYFLCDCPRCCDLEEDERMNSMKCSNKTCSGFVPIINKVDYAKCTSCGADVNLEKIEKYMEVVQFSDCHIQNMQNKDMAYLDVCKVALNKQNHLFHDLNIRKIKCLDLAFEASINLQRWNDALKYGRELHSGFRNYYGDYHPLLGHLYMKLLKLALLNDDVSEGESFYHQAEEIISITHGSSHPLYNSLQSLFRV